MTSRGHEPAADHAGQRRQNHATITEALAEHPARQGEHGARYQVEPDEQAEFRVAEREIRDEQGAYGRDGLELHRRANPRQEDEPQREPATPEYMLRHAGATRILRPGPVQVKGCSICF